MRLNRNSDPYLSGLLVVDKPPGMSSARAVAIVKRALNGAKVGHAGTLDPFATGVLIMLIGDATRKCEQMMSLPKTYEATIRLGATTATDDVESPEQIHEGSALGRTPVHPLESSVINQALQQFVGEIPQRPPQYSAIKVRGRRACDRVRSGENFQLHPRVVRIDSIDMLSYEWPYLQVRIKCGRGTYIRSLARDLGAALGIGGYLSALRRTRIGDFSVEQAIDLKTATQESIAEQIKTL
jgi:tRNA pseudouridine55 synthase